MMMERRWTRLHKLGIFLVLLQLVPLTFLFHHHRHLLNDVSTSTSTYEFLAPSRAFYSKQLHVYHNDTIFTSSPAENVRSISQRQYVLADTTNSSHHLPTTIYLEYAWIDMHGEIFYSIIREFCGTFPKDPLFRVGANPTFYLGPVQRITQHTIEIWKEFNDTAASCGAILFGTPDDPDLTVLTTTYANPTYTPDFIAQHVNNSKYLLICHDDKPEMEYATNIYWLTPLHQKYFIPNYFPPSFVARKQKRSTSPIPIFLVLGKATKRKRNIHSLVPILKHYENEEFIVRIMGKQFPPLFNQSVHCNKPWCDKIEYVHLPDAYHFMTNITEAHAILPLVDETNFFTTYQAGKKLSSSVMWAQGFGLHLVLYREVAYLYNVRGGYIYDENPKRKKMAPNVTHWNGRSGHRRSFISAFGECLRQIKATL